MDWRSRLLTPEEMLKLSLTEEGKHELAEYIISARLGRGLQQVFETLNVPLSAETQQQCYAILCDSVFRVPIDEVLKWAQSVAEGLDSTNFTSEPVGHC
jgi:hypothetical protein